MEKPKIRFKGYQEDWEQRKVTELGEIYIGLVTTMTEHYTDNGHLLIRNSDIKDGYFEFGENPIYLDEEFSEQNKSRMHQLGDVITVHTGDIGTSAVIGENEVNSIGFATIVTRPNQEILDSNYFATYLNTDTHKQWAVSMATGDGRSNYNLKDYTKLVVPIPEIEEQKKIAACIVNLNSLITLHQRKCEEMKILKKYMLQKMFPQNGQLVPQIRFSGFTEDWEQRKLPEFVTFFNGLTYTPEDVEETGTLVLRSSNVKNGEIVDADNVYVNDKVVTSENVQEGDIIVVVRNGSRALIGKHAQIKASMPNTVIGAFMSGMRSEHSSFVNALLDTSAFENEIAKNMGATINQITGYMFSKMEFMIPSGEEQQKIGEYFQGLDHLITLHQQKCDELRNIKKFMLQNMFI